MTDAGENDGSLLASDDHLEDLSGGPERHIPVLLNPVLEALGPKDGGVYVDGTFGAGGYSRAILNAADTTVIGIDQDPDAIAEARPTVDEYTGRLQLFHSVFSRLDKVAHTAGHETVDGVVLDIGVSSMQLDRAIRGFSFRDDGPLDMRMGQHGPSAADLVNELPERVLANVIYQFGEERKSRQIARRLVALRSETPFESTAQLTSAIVDVLGTGKPGAIHPATRTFQALRIAVNRELEELVKGLLAAERLLKPSGILAVVCFHSLESRIVKRFFTLRAQKGGGSRHQPLAVGEPASFEPLFRGEKGPDDEELARNPRSRSARLRAGVRTGEPPQTPPKELLALAQGPTELKEFL